jgi:hypothetical protein
MEVEGRKEGWKEGRERKEGMEDEGRTLKVGM